jgi:chromosome segregation ATPase
VFLQLASARGVEPETIDLEAILTLEGGEQAEAAATASAEAAAVAPAPRRGYDHVLAEKVLRMEEKVGMAIEALQRKEERISNQRSALRTLTGLEDQVRAQLADVTGENDNLRRELARLEAKNEMLQGHQLEKLSNLQLKELIGSLTEAVNRVRLTVQLRKLRVHQRDASPGKLSLLSPERHNRGRMSMSDMKDALDALKERTGGAEARALAPPAPAQEDA